MQAIKKFKELYDFGHIKDITPTRIEVRSRNGEYAVYLAKKIIKKHKLKLEVKEDAVMAAYNAFEVIEA